MSLAGKLVSVVDINGPAHKYYKVFKDETSHVPKICPKNIKKVEIHGGDWSKHGHDSIKTWYYTVDGKHEVFKERVEFDEKNLAVTLIGLEGDVFKYYKVFIGIYKVEPKGPAHSTVVLTLIYEKHDESCPYPYQYLDLMHNITKDIESHIKK